MLSEVLNHLEALLPM